MPTVEPTVGTLQRSSSSTCKPSSATTTETTIVTSERPASTSSDVFLVDTDTGAGSAAEAAPLIKASL